MSNFKHLFLSSFVFCDFSNIILYYFCNKILKSYFMKAVEVIHVQ